MPCGSGSRSGCRRRSPQCRERGHRRPAPHKSSGNDKLKGRGYRTGDAPLILALGVASGYTAVVVLALYLNSDAVLRLYQSPGPVWATVPILVYWLSWMWLRAARGEMHDDPLVFAFKDKNSLAAGALFAASLLLGSAGS